MPGADNVMLGRLAEKYTRELLGLRKDKFFFNDNPDIVDFNIGLIAEVKACQHSETSRSNKIDLLYQDQIERYLKRKNYFNKIGMVDGGRKPLFVNYFISMYNGSVENFELVDIYWLNEDCLLKILGLPSSKTKWTLNKNFTMLAKDIECGYQQTLDWCSAKDAVGRIIDRNSKSYIRLHVDELKEMCPESFIIKGVGVHHPEKTDVKLECIG